MTIEVSLTPISSKQHAITLRYSRKRRKFYKTFLQHDFSLFLNAKASPLGVREICMEEPTDEMLAQIMHEAAEIYNRENGEKSKEPPINSSPQHISIIVFPTFVFLFY